MQNNNNMHPHDIRNLIIFGIVSISLWILFEMYVLQPQKERIKERQRIERMIAEKEAETGIDILPRVVVRERDSVLGESGRIRFDNGVVKGSINLRGGRVDDLALKNYFQTLGGDEHVIILSPRDTENPRFVDYGWTSRDDSIRVPDQNTQWNISGNTELSHENPITLIWDNGRGLVFERVFSLDENYMFTVEQRVINTTGRSVQLFPYALITQTGLPREFTNMWIMHEGPIGFIGNELLQVKYDELRKDQRREKTADSGWIGITDKYWLTSIIPPQGVTAKFRYTHTQNLRDPDKGRFQVDYTGSVVEIPAGETASTSSNLFVGAKEVLVLDAYEKSLNIPKFNLAVDFGWFWFMTMPFFYLLHWIGLYVGNMGVAIIVLTLIIRMMVFPLTNTSYRSFAKMKKVSPQIMELRDKYGDDKQKLQQEIVAMYSREGVNPMAGCLPILIQIPIFFSLYKVFFVTIEMRHAPFFGWIKDLSARDPTSLFNLFGLLPYDVPAILMIGVWPCLMLVGMLLQKKLNPPPQDKFQRDLMNIFPFVIVFIMSKFSSGLVIYWAFSAYIGIAQQMLIMRSLGVPIYLFDKEGAKKEADMSKALDKGPDIHPLVEMAEDEVEDALFGETGEDGKPQDGKAEKAITPPKRKRSKKKK